MNNYFSPLLLILISITAIIFMVLYFNKKQEVNTFSSYYNTEGAFAGFILGTLVKLSVSLYFIPKIIYDVTPSLW